MCFNVILIETQQHEQTNRNCVDKKHFFISLNDFLKNIWDTLSVPLSLHLEGLFKLSLCLLINIKHCYSRAEKNILNMYLSWQYTYILVWLLISCRQYIHFWKKFPVLLITTMDVQLINIWFCNSCLILCQLIRDACV